MFARYRCSPEHKRHPGPWGTGQWHPRQPDISPCPADIRSDATPQSWLDIALAQSGCWDPIEGDRYVYWYDRGYDAFFVARRTQEAGADGQTAEYKGYPVRDHEMPLEVIEYLFGHKVIDTEHVTRIKRAKRRERSVR